MPSGQTNEYLIAVVNALRSRPSEEEWFEFKVDNSDPNRIGKYISALANAAYLQGQPYGYLIWGIRDTTHEIVGTSFDYQAFRHRQQPLLMWLQQALEPNPGLDWHDLQIDGKRVVLLQIGTQFSLPVRFQKEAYMRVGSATPTLSTVPELEKRLWGKLNSTAFELMVARANVNSKDVLELISTDSYFDLLEQNRQEGKREVLRRLEEEQMIQQSITGNWDILNLGAIALANRLSDFPDLRRKAVRVIRFSGSSTTAPAREFTFDQGFAVAFESIMRYVNDQVPVNEVIGQALRQNVGMFPPLALRELVANAVIHQDFYLTGSSPVISIFTDRIEITNPGEPLIEIDRLANSPPRSRNEQFAALMRRFRICEERGSGIDKVLEAVEAYQLPAPFFSKESGSMKVVLFAHKDLTGMSREERVRAVYWHACLCLLGNTAMTNTTVRARFGIEAQNAAQASRVINDALADGRIAIKDPNAGKKNRSYVPFWAAAENGRF